ncbi:MAG: methyltransferase [Candidatus Nanoarchaeia archaeon]|nr:methyltransferase [Candidatus Nanoarchaeia archaeon]MDD5587967.1 methyltransferase [Candidatus Nanoarchaeia archaeon]
MVKDPGEDSYFLSEYVKKYAFGNVLDMGTGSGVQSEAAKQNKQVKSILAVDVDKDAIHHVKKKGFDVRHSNLFSKIDPKEKFDFVIFNAPYMPDSDKGVNDNVSSLFKNSGGVYGFILLDKFLSDAVNHLNPNGRVLIACSSLIGDIEKLFMKYNLKYSKLGTKKLFFDEFWVYMAGFTAEDFPNKGDYPF